MTEILENTAGGCEKRTISSCARELEDIQGLLEGMSSDLNKKIKQKSLPRSTKGSRKRELSSAESLTEMVTCSNSEFEVETNRMSATDLDLLQYTLEAEIKSLHSQLQQVIDEDEDKAAEVDEKISLIQDRIYRCVTKKGQLVNNKYYNDFVKRHSDQYLQESDTESESEDLPPPKPSRFELRESLQMDELQDMSKSQLETLLRHHSIKYPDTAKRSDLLQLIENNILTRNSTDELWSPPQGDSLDWRDAGGGGDLKSSCETTLSLPATYISNYQGPTTPVEKTFSLKPGDLQDYLKYKAVSEKNLVDWDPTNLLKALYGKMTVESRKIKKISTLRQKKVNCIEGYLEKLPMNNLKAKPFRGFRRRYFKIVRGKLFYYENNKSEFPFGNIDITGSDVTAGDGLTINIIARLKFDVNKALQGNRLVLRCSSKEEHEDWLTALTKTASITPLHDTFQKQDSSASENKNDIVIMDFGASTIRAGLSSDDSPVLAFPSVFAVQQHVKTNRRFTNSGIPDPHSCKCGFEAFYPENRKDSKLVYPIRPIRTVDQYTIKVRYLPGFFEKIFHDLNIDSNGTTVVISCPRYLTLRNKEFLLDYLYVQMGVGAVYMQQQSVLALYSHNVTTGLIVDLGDHLDVLPIIEGSVIEKGVTSLPYAGQQITEFFSKLLTETGYRFFSDIESYLVRYLKEEVAAASVDFLDDMTSSPDPVTINVERFDMPMDKKEIRIGNTKYRCVEGLFNPGLWGKDSIPLHHMLVKAIKACGVDTRKQMCKSIYVTGGTSMIPGLPNRLEQELKSCFPDTVSGSIKVTASSHRLNASYKGAIVVAGLSNFNDLLITKHEWLNGDHEDLLSKWNV